MQCLQNVINSTKQNGFYLALQGLFLETEKITESLCQMKVNLC